MAATKRIEPGTRFARLVVIADTGHKHVRCRCDCGRMCEAIRWSLRAGRAKSCGCLRSDGLIARNVATSTTHGHTTGGKLSRTYVSWLQMIQRCENRKHNSFARYGGRGITVCDRWRQSFDAFLEDMGPRPDGHSLDRIDNSGDYEPDNARWATPGQQAQNQSTTNLIECRGEVLSLSEWSRRSRISRTGIRKRLLAGWSPERALTAPARKRARSGLPPS